MIHAIDLLLMLCCLATCLRLILYRRNGSRFKRHISLLAWVFIVMIGSIGLAILTDKTSSADLNPIIILSLICCSFLVFYTHGNVAELVRLTRRGIFH